MSLAVMPACEDDPAQPATKSPRLLALTSREAVLNNIEYAYNNRDIDVIDELLDPNFTFFFSDGDVGGEIPVQWARTDELGATNDLFISNSQPVPIGPVCESIALDLELEEVGWTAVIPEDWPEETWYAAEVPYTFTFKMYPDDSYFSLDGAKAWFVVREVPEGNETQWQLVEWRDIGATQIIARASDTSPETTWGAIKSLYR